MESTCWLTRAKLSVKRARKISPKPCIIWCMSAGRLRKKSMMDAMDCARILLKAGANPHHEDICGTTPFKWAASDDMHMLLEEAKRKRRW